MKKLTLLPTLLLTFLAFLGSVNTAAHADVVQKSPRVAELEDKLTRDASNYLRGRFPSQPFLVVVTIDPLRREEGSRPKAQAQDQDLPYFDMEADEVKDEWDDPQISLGELMLRIKKAVVTISLPNTVSDDEAIEIKNSIFSFLHLTPARDEIQIERKKWSSGQDFTKWWTALGVVGFLMLSLLAGLFFIYRSSTHKLTSALMDSRGSASGGASGGGASAVAAMPPPEKEQDQKKNGDLRFSDPIRIRELTIRLIDTILTNKSFPNHVDMLILDQFGRTSSAELGAVLAEFPMAMQKTLFSLSYHSCWLEAFSRQGSLSLSTLEVLQALARNVRDEKPPELENLLIYVWRLDDQMTNFIRTVNQNEAFAILAELPKSMSIAVARKAFPGSWGSLLDPAFSPPKLDKKEITDLCAAALKVKPLYDFSALQRYKNDLEIIEYLKSADLAEERDVYVASPRDSMLHRIRKPFYPVFEQTPEVLGDLVGRIPFDQWQYALFNIGHAERKNIEALFSEKQKFMFQQKMRQFDSQPPDREIVSASRARIARVLSDLLIEKAAPPAKEDDSPPKAAQRTSTKVTELDKKSIRTDKDKPDKEDKEEKNVRKSTKKAA